MGKKTFIVLILLCFACANSWAMRADYGPYEKNPVSGKYLQVDPEDKKSLQEYGLKLVAELVAGKKYKVQVTNKNKFPFIVEDKKATLILRKGSDNRWYLVNIQSADSSSDQNDMK